MPLIADFRYRPEIDGLRAIAVMAVVLFHAGLGVPGGFIGVDVFFVISGFLITSLILKDLESGKFTLAHFWERRARRIIPASVVMVLAVLIAGWFLLLPSDYANLGKSTAWQAVFGANFHFWRNTNYFAGAAEEQPLLHTWSLAVEEQFYLFVPVLLLALFHFPAFRRRGALLALFLTGFLLSLTLSILLVPRMPAAAFYLLPTRAWELLCGSIVAILPAAAIPRWVREILSFSGLAAILVPCFLYTKETSFPGLAALPPCLGTALFIWAANQGAGIRRLGSEVRSQESGGQGNSAQSPEVREQPAFNSYSLASCVLPSCVLGLRPIVFIGLISYSLYLWHWPFFSFSAYWALEPISLAHRLILVAASLVLATLSWKLIEMPFRSRRFGVSRSSMFAYATVGLSSSFALGIALVSSEGRPARLPQEAVAYAAAADEQHSIRFVNLADAQAQNFPKIGNASGGERPHFILWGDSHAGVLVPALQSWSAEANVTGLAAVYSSTAPVLGIVQNSKFGIKGQDSVKWGEAIAEYAAIEKIPNVILAARWHEHFRADLYAPGIQSKEVFERALLTTVKRLTLAGSKIWIVLDVPNHPYPVPRALARNAIFSERPRYSPRADQQSKLYGDMMALKPSLLAEGATILDPTPLFTDASGNLTLQSGAQALYSDSQHLSRAGAMFIRSVFSPVFGISSDSVNAPRQ
jgi:peptidoglycan/LPS O-acetylase OafA/YrhL